jgi:hypothetical protein
MLKYSQFFGIAAAIVLVISGFLPWTWHPDIQKYFSGFVSENNAYGKPGKVFIFLAVIAIVFYAVPRLWAKRWNVFVNAMTLAYAIKSFILFSGCYSGICPERQYGIWIMLVAAFAMMAAAVLPDLKLTKTDEQ